MPRMTKELSATEVRRIEKPGLHAVGGVAGLMLQVTDTGAKSWILRASTGEQRMSANGKPFVARRDFGLGGFPTVTLGGARERARELREQLRQGIDPVAERKAARRAAQAAHANRLTFAQAAEACHAVRLPGFSSDKHAREWLSTLERLAFPTIGAMPVAEIKQAHVLQVLQPIWATKNETATRVRQRMEAVLRWAKVAGHCTGDNPAAWAGNLQELLPKPAAVQTVEHHKALPWREVPGFMAELAKRPGLGARALEFAILTACRSGEVRGATWAEVDLAAKTWTIPAERMKARKAHTVPLSAAAVALLEALPRMAGSELVFTAPRGGTLSDMSLLAVVRRIGVAAVPHGFRSSFKDWARSCSAYPDELSELALAHVNSDATRAAYARSQLVEERRALMADWARFLSEPAPRGNVVGILEARG